MRRGSIWITTLILLFGSCAIPEPPPGGPEDKTPPKVVETFPEDGAVGVAPDAMIGVGFSEKMQRARLQRLVSMSPPAVIAKTKWDKNAVKFSFEEPLHPDTTYLVELKRGYGDSHGVKSDEPFRFAFATSSHIDSGVIAGRILFRREPSEKGVVRLFVMPRDTAFAPEATRPEREVWTAEDGTYHFTHLPSSGQSFLIWAYHDANGNGNFERDEEAGGLVPDTLTLGAGVSVLEDQNIAIVDPKEPAVIAGVIVNNTGVDSIPSVVTLHSLTDSTAAIPAYYVRCDSLGHFEMKNVLMGAYSLFGFLDFSGDSLCGDYPCPGDSSRMCVEPCVQRADTLFVEPGDEIDIEDLILGGEVETGDDKEEE